MRFWNDNSSESAKPDEKTKLSGWKRFRYWGEIFVWALLGIWLGRNFGLMSFEFWAILITIAVFFSLVKQWLSGAPSSQVLQIPPVAVIEDVTITNSDFDQ